jgi:hypothetical protein
MLMVTPLTLDIRDSQATKLRNNIHCTSYIATYRTRYGERVTLYRTAKSKVYFNGYN